MSDFAEFFFLLSQWNTLKDSIIATADFSVLVACKYWVLSYHNERNLQVCALSDTANYILSLSVRNVHTTLNNEINNTMSEQYFNCYFRILFFLVRKVYNSSCDTVCHLIRMAWIYFFNHNLLL